MKRILLLFSIFIIAIMGDKGIVNEIASSMQMEKEEVQTCFNKTNILRKDLIRFDQMISDNLRTTDFDDSSRRTGCFFACLTERKGLMINGQINTQVMRKSTYSENEDVNQGREQKIINIFNMCAKEANTKTDPCKVSFEYLLCVANETISQNKTI